MISIIVPIYKVEQYLVKCLDSILNQTYKNLEIILVDDGSPDNCPTICEEYANKDERIKVIHQKNGGLSAARNTGINNVSGEYIAFIDSDDYIHERMYEILYKNLKEKKADISVCKFIKVTNSEQMNNPIGQEKIDIFNNMEAMENLYNEWYLPTVIAWNKLYKKDLFQTVKYPVGEIHEDEFVIHHILDNVKTVVYSDAPLYFYRQRDTSIMGEPYNLSRLDEIKAYKERMLFFEKKGYLDLQAQAYRGYLDSLILNYNLVKKYYSKEREVYCKLRRDFMEGYLNSSIVLPIKARTVFKLFSFNPFLHKLVLKFWNLKNL
jgi:glycosyltransferase involved in cell wall biosynthesis